jgi:DNA-binding response OmpR family regulator
VAEVLVVEDSPELALTLKLLLERAGHAVAVAGDGQRALDAFADRPADLVVLDVGLPVLDGWATLERLRDVSDVPVLMLTAHDGEFERVRGLQEGADDYQVKPFSPPELLARIGALLRRRVTDTAPTRYADDWVEVDFTSRAVHGRDGAPVELTAQEFRLLAAFVRHPGEVLTHADLLRLAWHEDTGTRDQVKTYVRYLRRKLDWPADSPVPLEAVRGVGYRFSGGPSRA